MKEDEGPYSITVTNPAGEDKAELFVKIVGQSLVSYCLFAFIFTAQLTESCRTLIQNGHWLLSL